MSTIRFANQAEPDFIPKSGRTLFYFDDVDRLPRIKRDDGSVVPIGIALPFSFVADPVADAAVTAAVIDANGGVVVTTTTTSNSQTLSAPTETTGGKGFVFVNDDTSTHNIIVNGIELIPSNFLEFVWDGSAWLTPRNADLVPGQQISYTSTATDLTTSGQDIIGITDTSIARIITISSIDIVNTGKSIVIKDESGGAGTNNILIDTEGSETIDGETLGISITVGYGNLRIYSNGTDLFSF